MIACISVPTIINRLFSLPKNFDERIKMIVFGITAKLRIGIISAELIKCGNKIGISSGPKVIPKTEIIIEINSMIILNLFEFIPAASFTNKSLNDIIKKVGLFE